MSFFWPAPTEGWTVDPCSRSWYFISLGVSTSNPLDLSSLGPKSFHHASYWPAGKALQSTRRESCLSKQSHKVFGGEFLSFWFFLILSELLKEKGCRIVFGWFLPQVSYHLPCICNSLELEPVILHGICYTLAWSLCILHGICYICRRYAR